MSIILKAQGLNLSGIWGESFKTSLFEDRLMAAMQRVGISSETFAALIDFKSAEDKNDPARRLGIHGPYEELYIRKNGRLPDDYFDAGDPLPWGLRVENSRSNILWQVVSGMLDSQPDFGAAYMALAVDLSLSDDDYCGALTELHQDWNRYMDRAGEPADHHHGHMHDIYHAVNCPACSLAAAAGVRAAAVNEKFKEMMGLTPQKRQAALKAMGLGDLMNVMIPDRAEKAPGWQP